MNHDLGGFYASQDADVKPGDDGSYFTWSLDQAKTVLTDSELRVVQAYYGIYETGEMPHDRTQNVLYVEKSVEEISGVLHIPIDTVTSLLTSARNKMIKARGARRSPFVDKTIYASWNAMMISAYFEFLKVFESDHVLRAAIRSLDRILQEHTLGDGTISHCAGRQRTDGFLDDQVEVVNALLNAFEVTADHRYLERAMSLMKQTVDRFGDHAQGGFFDTPNGRHGTGLLGIPLKPVQDTPVASANSVAICALNKLYAFTGDVFYRECARKSLEALTSSATGNGIYSSNFHLALREFLNPPPHVVIIAKSNDPRGKDLHRSALRAYRPGKTVAWYEPSALHALPEILVSTVKGYSEPIAYVCSEHSCAPPAKDQGTLTSTILAFGRT
jgi:uncharacterized protein YyaL (SSP411 family)